MEAERRHVKLTIVSANSVPTADKDFTNSCDPYIKIKLNNSAKDRVTNIGETQICKQTLHPVWNETFEFDLASETLELHLWGHALVTSDANVTHDFRSKYPSEKGQYPDRYPNLPITFASDDLIGVVTVPVGEIIPNEPVWLPIPKNQKYWTAPHSRICIKLSGHNTEWMPMKTSERWNEFKWKDSLFYHPKMECVDATTVKLPGSGQFPCMLRMFIEPLQHQDIVSFGDMFFVLDSYEFVSTVMDHKFSIGARTGGVQIQYFNLNHELVRALLLLPVFNEPGEDNVFVVSLQIAQIWNEDLKSYRPNYSLLPLWSGFISQLHNLD